MAPLIRKLPAWPQATRSTTKCADSRPLTRWLFRGGFSEVALPIRSQDLRPLKKKKKNLLQVTGKYVLSF